MTDDSDRTHLRAEAHLERAQAREAIALLDVALADNPQDVRALLLRSRAQQMPTRTSRICIDGGPGHSPSSGNFRELLRR